MDKSLLFFLTLSCAAVLGQGISFQGATVPASVQAPVAVVSGDFDGDAKLDVAVADAAASKIEVLYGKGDGTFATPVNAAPAGCTPVALYAADFSGDGLPDLLSYCTPSSSYVVLISRRDRTWSAPVFTQNYTTPITSTFVWSGAGGTMASADFDHDGKLDLVAATLSSSDAGTRSFGEIFGGMASERLLLFPGRGDGSFGTAVTINVGSIYPVSAVAGDFTSDGNADLAVTVVQPNPATDVPEVFIEILAGDGKGSFAIKGSLPISFFGATLRVADLNGDGKADLVTAGPMLSTMEGTVASGLATFVGDGAGNFVRRHSETEQYDSVGLLLADLRGAGTPDMVEFRMSWAPGVAAGSVIAGLYGQTVVRRGVGDGTFLTPVPVPLAQSEVTTGVAGGDFDGDGRLDLAIAHISGPQINAAYASVDSPAGALRAIATLSSGALDLFRNSTAPTSFVVTNAAGYQRGPQAAGSIVTAWGGGLAAATASLTELPIPTTLGGASVSVTDSAGVTRPARLFYVSPTQINFEVPVGTALGQSTVAVSYGSVVVSQKVTIAPVAPGVFHASGIAVGNIGINRGGQVEMLDLIQVAAGGVLAPRPIDASQGDQVFLVLYGTGIRNWASKPAVTIGATTLTADYAGAQGYFAGEDQINVLLPRSLAGQGVVDLVVTVDGQASNAVKVRIL